MRPGRRPPAIAVGREAARVGRFAVVGVAATIVHAGSYVALVSAGLMSPMWANVIGFAAAFLVSLAGQYGWTFADRTRGLAGRRRRAAMLRFAGVAAAGFLMNAGFVALVEAIPGADPRLAAVFMVGVTPAATFLLTKYWAFGDAGPAVRSSDGGTVREGQTGGRGRGAPVPWLVPAIAIAAAAPLLASSLTFGVPQVLDPDEMIFMGAALRMLSQQSLDPGWYGAPAQPLIYALGAVYTIYIVVLDQVGVIGSLADAASFYFADRTPFLVLGRLIPILSATGCLVVMVAILREIRAGLAAIMFAILLFTLSPLVLSFSSVIRMDFQQILFNLLTSYFCLIAITRGAEARNLLLAGACVGVAVTSKYTGVAGAATVAATTAWLVAKGRLGPAAGVGLLIASGLASLAAAFVTGPFLFLSYADVLADIANEARPSHLGATSRGFLPSLLYYTTEAAPAALGWGAWLAALVGLVLSLGRPIGVVSVPFVVAYLLFVSSLNLYWYRWFLPVVPFAAVFLAVAVESALARLGDRRGGRGIVVVGIAGLLVAPTVVSGLEVARYGFFDLDTRVRALEWVESTLPRGARVLMETDAPGISSRDYAAFIVEPDRIVLWGEVEEHARVTGYYTYFGMWRGPPEDLVAAIRRERIDFILMSNWQEWFEREAETYPHEVEVYAALRREFPMLHEFAPAEREFGPRLRVLVADGRELDHPAVGGRAPENGPRE